MLRFLILLILPAVAYGMPCEKLEFTEMDAMTKEDLLRLRCQYKADMDQSIRDGMLNLSNRCVSETIRMDRILGKKYQLKRDSSEEFPYLLEIDQMCRRKS